MDMTERTPNNLDTTFLRSHLTAVSGLGRIALFRRSEEVMGRTPFSKPVFLKLHSTGNFQARSAWEAYEYLDLHWSAAKTAHYRQALTLCRSAMDNLVEAEVARLAVIDAAQRAGLLATKWEVNGEPTNTSYVAVEGTWRKLPPMDHGEVTEDDLSGYFHAADIVNDPELSPSRKKALLAFWASDINAVAGAPNLRCVRGVTVTIDSIFEAMARLDTEIDHAAMVLAQRGSGETW